MEEQVEVDDKSMICEAEREKEEKKEREVMIKKQITKKKKKASAAPVILISITPLAWLPGGEEKRDKPTRLALMRNYYGLICR